MLSAKGFKPLLGKDKVGRLVEDAKRVLQEACSLYNRAKRRELEGRLDKAAVLFKRTRAKKKEAIKLVFELLLGS